MTSLQDRLKHDIEELAKRYAAESPGVMIVGAVADESDPKVCGCPMEVTHAAIRVEAPSRRCDQICTSQTKDDLPPTFFTTRLAFSLATEALAAGGKAAADAIELISDGRCSHLGVRTNVAMQLVRDLHVPCATLSLPGKPPEARGSGPGG